MIAMKMCNKYFCVDSNHSGFFRSEKDFLHPERDYEKVGEVNEVCFVEGLVFFKGKWFLYYGTGDSKIAVAVSNQGPL